MASAAFLTSYTYFFADDFIFLQQARTQAFGWRYLREPLFEHFSPVTRTLNKVLVDVAPGSFGFAHGVQLGLYAAALVAFAFAIWTILGGTWGALALTALFGQSLFLMRLLNWWTATANILPSTILTLLAIGGYLRWRRTRSRSWLVVSLAAFAGSLLDYETAALFPAYLALIALLVLEDDLSPRAWVGVLWRERWAWLAYGFLESVALFNFFHSYYHRVSHPSPAQLVHFLEIATLEAFVPALFGTGNPQLAGSVQPMVVVGGGLLIAALVSAALYLRPRAWRCLVAFGLVVLITMVPLGLNRIRLFGVGIGYELYYEQSLQFMFLILTAFGLSRRWGGERHGGPRRPRQRSAVVSLRVLGIAAAAAYGLLYVSSVNAMTSASWQPRASRAYVDTFLASRDRVKALTGKEPVLINRDLPTVIIPAIFAPFNRYDEYFPVIDSRLRFDEVADPEFVVSPRGRLQRVRFAGLSGALLRKATVSALDGSGFGRAPSGSDGSVCTPSRPSASRLHIALSVPRRLRVLPSGLPYGVRIGYEMPVRARVNVLVANRGASELAGAAGHVWGPGPGEGLAEVTVSRNVDTVEVDLPRGSCITSLTLGAFVFAR